MIEKVGKAVDAAGVVVTILGGLAATLSFALAWWRSRQISSTYVPLRRNLGRAILLGLEFLVAGDIIRTIAVSPTFRRLGLLAIVVAIRTSLSFALELELTGRGPWEKKDEPTAFVTPKAPSARDAA